MVPVALLAYCRIRPEKLEVLVSTHGSQLVPLVLCFWYETTCQGLKKSLIYSFARPIGRLKKEAARLPEDETSIRYERAT